MALSYYYNFQTPELEPVPDYNFDPLPDYFFDFNDAFSFEPNYFESLFSPEYNNIGSNNNNNVNSTTFESSYDPQETHPPKRYKQMLYDELLVEPELSGPHRFAIRAANDVTGQPPSAQSVTARERRRRISEKTRELGSLVPGAHRMNTAEMFRAAYKYIEFLRAQVGILEFMGSYEKVYESHEEMNGLLGSCLVQEKLYGAGRCMVPSEFVRGLANEELKGFEGEIEFLIHASPV
ncbi:Transcription factor bHLH52 [Striga hermonthica]|uniref:Transcription factor bHLH52 n=1 Tax=Striga hermonthica TaxID=68872 RepID=A0A9N7RGZ4_STRHE|nr:Transcription factor bHLH52 [Striga hermonthica]